MLITVLDFFETVYEAVDPTILKWEHYLGPISEDTAEQLSRWTGGLSESVGNIAGELSGKRGSRIRTSPKVSLARLSLFTGRNQNAEPATCSAHRLSLEASAGRPSIPLDFQASKRAFLDARMTDFRYIHVSTHAMVDMGRPELSSIVLSQVDPSGRPVDGRIRLFELYNLHTAADLVTLSARRTGMGKQARGEGLLGLTRAVLFGGAKSVLVTLWPVEDEGTSVFMREFFSNLLGPRPLRPVAALRRKRMDHA